MSQTGKVIVLLGPPGSGKSSLLNKIGRNSEIAVLESGDLLRQETEQESEQSRKIESIMEKGKLVPSELIMDIVGMAMRDIAGMTVVFDGFPRQKDQIIPFFAMIEENKYRLSSVIILQVAKDAAIKRIIGRRLCSGCGAVYNISFDPPSKKGICDYCTERLFKRKDDTIETAIEQWDTYEKQTKPVVEYFEKNYPGMIRRISADKDISQVTDLVLSVVRSISSSAFP